MRLRGGFGTPCDPIHSGFIEVLHFDEWGSICTDRSDEDVAESNLVADVVCRQLGFPHGTRVDPLTPQPPSPPSEEDDAASPYSAYYYSRMYDYNLPEEAEEPVERFWLSSVQCRGPEGRLIDCDLGPGFRSNNQGCSSTNHRLHIACRQFPVVEALESVTTPEAGACYLWPVSEAHTSATTCPSAAMQEQTAYALGGPHPYCSHTQCASILIAILRSFDVAASGRRLVVMAGSPQSFQASVSSTALYMMSSCSFALHNTRQ